MLKVENISKISESILISRKRLTVHKHNGFKEYSFNL